MLFKRRDSIFLFAILTVFSLILALPGCKEGTEKSPVSSLFTNINSSQFAKLPESDKHFTIEGMVVENSPTYNYIEGVTVNLYYKDLLVMQKLSTSEGKFFFYDIPPGQYKIVVAEDDKKYKSSSTIIEILPDGNISVATTTFKLDKIESER